MRTALRTVITGASSRDPKCGLLRALFLAVLFVFVVMWAPILQNNPPMAEAPDVIALEIGKAKLIRLPATPNVVMLGNPAVADVVMEDNGLLFLLGREPGETNLMILNRGGKVILSSAVVVGPMDKRRVTVDRGPQTFTLSCNPRCVPVATPKGSGATTAATGGNTAVAAGPDNGDPAAGGSDAASDIANALGSLLGQNPAQK